MWSGLSGWLVGVGFESLWARWVACVCVLQAGKVALDVGWAREEFQIGRGRESGEGERGGFWNGLPFLALAGLFIVEGRREAAVWFVLREFCGNRKKLCSS